ncbi:MAG: DUF2851 family protein [Aquificota bacterium]|nr:MAG: DUF2851 family protein [Aquificota bacterium]
MKNIDASLLEKLGERWLKTKIQRMKNLLRIAEADEALYREIMLSLGYPKNKTQFLELALITPFKEIKKLKEREKIEKALLHRAGFIELREGSLEGFDLSLKMDKSVWNFKNIRPANYPDRRIKGISVLLAESLPSLVEYFLTKITREEKELVDTPEKARQCVNRIMDFKGIGILRKREMFFNIILPFYLAYLEGKKEHTSFLERLFQLHPPLSENSITKSFRLQIGEKYDKLVRSVKAYFGLHLLHKLKNSEENML